MGSKKPIAHEYHNIVKDNARLTAKVERLTKRQESMAVLILEKNEEVNRLELLVENMGKSWLLDNVNNITKVKQLTAQLDVAVTDSAQVRKTVLALLQNPTDGDGTRIIEAIQYLNLKDPPLPGQALLDELVILKAGAKISRDRENELAALRAVAEAAVETHPEVHSSGAARNLASALAAAGQSR